VLVLTSNLTSGNTKSCGCLNLERVRKQGYANRAHGAIRTATWNSWQAARQRCHNPSNHNYPNYGGRGILFDSRWDNFAVFLADMGERPDETTLDRVDTNGPYSPENCRWSTYRQQGNNRRDNRTLTVDGVTRTIAEWAYSVGMARGVLYNRIDAGWDVERALTTPTRKMKPKSA